MATASTTNQNNLDTCWKVDKRGKRLFFQDVNVRIVFDLFRFFLKREDMLMVIEKTEMEDLLDNSIKSGPASDKDP